MKKEYPHIRFGVVLAYMPGERREYDYIDYNDTLYPDGLETVPKRFAISHRNRWMVKNSELIVTYVTYSHGGAWQASELARRQGKFLMNLGKHTF